MERTASTRIALTLCLTAAWANPAATGGSAVARELTVENPRRPIHWIDLEIGGHHPRWTGTSPSGIEAYAELVPTGREVERTVSIRNVGPEAIVLPEGWQYEVDVLLLEDWGRVQWMEPSDFEFARQQREHRDAMHLERGESEPVRLERGETAGFPVSVKLEDEGCHLLVARIAPSAEQLSPLLLPIDRLYGEQAVPLAFIVRPWDAFSPTDRARRLMRDGDLAGRRSEHERALELYDRALSFTPESQALTCRKGYVLEELGRLQDARDAYHRVIQLQEKKGVPPPRAGSCVLGNCWHHAKQRLDSLAARGVGPNE